MCQAFEAEQNYLIRSELAEIKDAYVAHVSGNKPLSDDELYELAIRKLMLCE